jgi:signal transduction histidine kinase
MISEYETPCTAIECEHELSVEELAKFAREELPLLVDQVLDELMEQFDLPLGLSLAELGVVCQKTCHAGVRFGSVDFSIQGLGMATIFGGLSREESEEEEEPRRVPLDTVLEMSAFFVKRVLEQKIQDLARSRNERFAKQMFLHEAAHGIAAVESTFIGLEDLLRSYVDDFSPGDKEDARQFLSVLKREYQIHRMGLLNLLDYYHPAAFAEIQRSLITVCNPAELLWDLLPLYKPLARARNVRFDEDLENWHDMPRVRLDKAAITRSLHNVLWNAIKYSYRSVVSPAAATDRFIRVSCRPLYNPGHNGEGQECAIEVENFGLGIKPDEISKVTRPAFRGEAAIKEKVLGSGLGLYETERILRNHGGRLRITSKQVHSDTYLTRVVLILPYRTILA